MATPHSSRSSPWSPDIAVDRDVFSPSNHTAQPASTLSSPRKTYFSSSLGLPSSTRRASPSKVDNLSRRLAAIATLIHTRGSDEVQLGYASHTDDSERVKFFPSMPAENSPVMVYDSGNANILSLPSRPQLAAVLNDVQATLRETNQLAELHKHAAYFPTSSLEGLANPIDDAVTSTSSSLPCPPSILAEDTPSTDRGQLPPSPTGVTLVSDLAAVWAHVHADMQPLDKPAPSDATAPHSSAHANGTDCGRIHGSSDGTYVDNMTVGNAPTAAVVTVYAVEDAAALLSGLLKGAADEDTAVERHVTSTSISADTVAVSPLGAGGVRLVPARAAGGRAGDTEAAAGTTEAKSDGTAEREGEEGVVEDGDELVTVRVCVAGAEYTLQATAEAEDVEIQGVSADAASVSRMSVSDLPVEEAWGVGGHVVSVPRAPVLPPAPQWHSETDWGSADSHAELSVRADTEEESKGSAEPEPAVGGADDGEGHIDVLGGVRSLVTAVTARQHSLRVTAHAEERAWARCVADAGTAAHALWVRATRASESCVAEERGVRTDARTGEALRACVWREAALLGAAVGTEARAVAVTAEGTQRAAHITGTYGGPAEYTWPAVRDVSPTTPIASHTTAHTSPFTHAHAEAVVDAPVDDFDALSDVLGEAASVLRQQIAAQPLPPPVAATLPPTVAEIHVAWSIAEAAVDWSLLPLAALARVASFLRRRELQSCTAVSRRWYGAWTQPCVLRAHWRVCVEAVLARERERAREGESGALDALLAMPRGLEVSVVAEGKELRKRVATLEKLRERHAKAVEKARKRGEEVGEDVRTLVSEEREVEGAVAMEVLELVTTSTQEMVAEAQGQREDLTARWTSEQTVLQFLRAQLRDAEREHAIATGAKVLADNEADARRRQKEHEEHALAAAEAAEAEARKQREQERDELQRELTAALAALEHAKDQLGVAAVATPITSPDGPPAALAYPTSTVLQSPTTPLSEARARQQQQALTSSTNPFSPSFAEPLPALKAEKKVLIRAVKQLRADLADMRAANAALEAQMRAAGVAVPTLPGRSHG